jgi:CHAT domain-containing protein
MLGLQRAFQVAGVRSTVTSLWKVDDAATQALMVEFYKNLWERRMSKLEALRQAQLTMLNRYDSSSGELKARGLTLTNPGQKASADTRLAPYYWASFVLSGDWQ